MVPGDVDDVDCRLAWAQGQEWLAREGIDRLASFVPGDVQAGYADPPALGYAQVDQRVMERAEG